MVIGMREKLLARAFGVFFNLLVPQIIKFHLTMDVLEQNTSGFPFNV